MTKKLDWRRVLCILIACVVMFGAVAVNASAAAWTSTQEIGLTIHYLYEETEVVGAEFRLYKVGSVEQDGSIIILSNQFEDYPVPTDGWAETDYSELAYTLAGYVLRDGLEPYDSGVTDEFGMLYLPSEASQPYEPGVYLLIGLPIEVNGMLVTPTPTLFYLPSVTTSTGSGSGDGDGTSGGSSSDVTYDTIIFPKSEAVPIVPIVVPVVPGQSEPAPEVPTLTSVKLWNDAGHESVRPSEVQVQLINEFLTYLVKIGRSTDTIRTYRAHLKRIFSLLPEDHVIRHGTLDNLLSYLKEEENYSNSTVNVSASVANGLFEYCDRRDLQVKQISRKTASSQPTMTRRDYQNLLLACRRKGDERTYLIVKVFANLGIGVTKLHNVTAEAVRVGAITVADDNGAKETRRIPHYLQGELENYIERQDIQSGPVFLNQVNNSPLARVTISYSIAVLSEDSGVSREKCNPRCLQRLYQDTRDNLKKNMLLQMEQMYEIQLEQEQLLIGWTNSNGLN